MQLTKVSKMGEPDETYGQTFWCEVNDSLTPVRFSSKQEFEVGDNISYESSEQRKGKKDYLQLRGVKKVQTTAPTEKTQQTGSQSVSGITKEQGDRIIELLEKLANEDEVGNIDI